MILRLNSIVLIASPSQLSTKMLFIDYSILPFLPTTAALELPIIFKVKKFAIAPALQDIGRTKPGLDVSATSLDAIPVTEAVLKNLKHDTKFVNIIFRSQFNPR